MKNFASLLLLLILFNPAAMNAQDVPVIRLSGIVLRLDSLKPVPYTNIYIKSNHLGVISDQRGLFSLNVHKKDTIVFSSVGSKTTFFIVPDTMTGSSYSIIQKMPYDTITLKTVEINSWPTLSQFNEAFTEEKGFDRDFTQAQINSESILDIDYSKDIDMKNYMEMTGGKYTNVYENASIPLTDVLNPKRWDKLISDWKSGKHR